jgi:hypothetical protein
MSHRERVSTPSRRAFIDLGGKAVGGYVLSRLFHARLALAHVNPYRIAPIREPATVLGSIRYEGTVPAPILKLVSSDFAIAGREPRRWEALNLGAGNVLRHAVVVLNGIAAGKAFAPTVRLAYAKGAEILARTEAYGLEQPEITMDVENRDPILHSWVSSLGARTLANTAHPPGAPALKVRFKEPGLYQITCAPHPWERAFRFIVPHPYSRSAAPTEASGSTMCHEESMEPPSGPRDSSPRTRSSTSRRPPVG